MIGMGTYMSLLTTDIADVIAASSNAVTASKVFLCIGLLLLGMAVVSFMKLDMRSLFCHAFSHIKRRSAEFVSSVSTMTQRLDKPLQSPENKENNKTVKTGGILLPPIPPLKKEKEIDGTTQPLPPYPPKNYARTANTQQLPDVSVSTEPGRHSEKYNFASTYSLVYIHTDERA